MKRWTYTNKSLPGGGTTSDTKVCWNCHKNVQALVLGQWSIRHYYTFAMRFCALMHKYGLLQETSIRTEVNNQVPKTILGWITRLHVYSTYALLKLTTKP